LGDKPLISDVVLSQCARKKLGSPTQRFKLRMCS
jgi:hypothetical protein